VRHVFERFRGAIRKRSFVVGLSQESFISHDAHQIRHRDIGTVDAKRRQPVANLGSRRFAVLSENLHDFEFTLGQFLGCGSGHLRFLSSFWLCKFH
jgi:hypothetical protein